jgi:hypothetical protein
MRRSRGALPQLRLVGSSPGRRGGARDGRPLAEPVLNKPPGLFVFLKGSRGRISSDLLSHLNCPQHLIYLLFA